MSSNTKKTKLIRKKKVRAQAKKKKVKLAKGSTPRFPVHVEDAPEAVVPQPPGSGNPD